MRKDGVPPNTVTLRSVLLALENAPIPPEAAAFNEVSTSASEPENGSLETEPGYPGQLGEWFPSSGFPWEVAFSLLGRMAEGSEGVFPGPRDFSAGLTAACFAGAEWSSISKVRVGVLLLLWYCVCFGAWCLCCCRSA